MPFRRRGVSAMVVANALYEKVCFWNAVELLCNDTSRDRSKTVADFEMTLQPNYNKSFLKWGLWLKARAWQELKVFID